MIEPKLYRDGMARLAGAVQIIATSDGTHRQGATAIAVASISDNPATLLVCLNKESHTAKAILANGSFCVNSLQANDHPLADIFAGQKGVYGSDKFVHGSWSNIRLLSSLVSFECQLESTSTHHTHIIFIGRVNEVHIGEENRSLVYVNRGYKEV